SQVIAVLAVHVLVLTDLGEDQELVVEPSPDLSGISLDHHVAEPTPIEDPPVRVLHRAVGPRQPLVVPIEGVRVLHQELAGTQEPEPGPELVPVLPFGLVEGDREVLVAGELAGDERGHDLLLGGTETQLAAMAILELEHQVAVDLPSPRDLPRIGRDDDGHPDLLRASCVDLAADDGFDLPQSAPPQWEPGVDACRQLPDVAGAQQEPMRGNLGFRGRLAQRSGEELRHPHVASQDTRRPAGDRSPRYARTSVRGERPLTPGPCPRGVAAGPSGPRRSGRPRPGAPADRPVRSPAPTPTCRGARRETSPRRRARHTPRGCPRGWTPTAAA